MKLPFTEDQFLAVFGSYNRAVWPVVVLLWLLTAGSVLLLYRRGPPASRLIALMLGVHWIWAGAVYQFVYFRRINPAATLFAIAFVLEGMLFLWRGVVRRHLSFVPRRSLSGSIALVLIAYGLIYPALGIAFGLAVPDFPSFGVPCPTTILTAGLLLLLARPEARRLAIVPILWSMIGGSAALLLGIRADLALPAAGLILLIDMIRPAPAKAASPG